MPQQKLIFDHQRCTGCRACEIACTFHHQGEFGRRGGSLEVRRDSDSGEIELVHILKPDTSRPVCDLCRGENAPLCVKFCSAGAITLNAANTVVT